MTDRADEGYGFPDDDDGPDVTQARRAFAESQARTDEIDVVVRENKARVAELTTIGINNHFIEKWHRIIAVGRAS